MKLLLANLFKALVLKKKIPFLVVINLTNRCLGRCKYCGVWNDYAEEMNTDEVFSLIDEVKEMGTRWIGLTGGDPLLRDDIDKIISHIKFRNLKAHISLDSHLVLEKKQSLEKIDSLQLSLDGPPDIHDFQRYKGSYDNFLKAMNVAIEKNIRFHTLTVLTKYNKDSVNYILDLAKRYKFLAFFQPVNKTYFLESSLLEKFKLNKEDYKKLIEQFIYLKQKYEYLGNSLRGFKFLLEGDKKYRCFGGRYFAYVHNNGDVYPCWTPPSLNILNCKKVGFRKAFRSIPDFNCPNGCHTASCIEFNYAHSFNLKTLKLYIKRFFSKLLL